MASIFFDFDGTLSKGGFKVIDRKSLLSFFKKLMDFVPQKSGYMSSKLKSKVFERIWGFYIKNKSEKQLKKEINETLREYNIKLFPGVKETLKQLKEEGHELHIISRSPIEFVETILENEGIKEIFDSIHATKAQKIDRRIGRFNVKFYTEKMDVKPSTPKERAETILRVLKEKNRLKDDIVVVGDSWTDAQTTIELLKRMRAGNVKLVIKNQKGIKKIAKKIKEAGGSLVVSEGHPMGNIRKAIT